MVLTTLAAPIAGRILKRLLKKAGSKVLEKVADKGKVGEVIEAIAGEAGADPSVSALEELASQDPDAFARAVEAVEASEAHRWAVLLSETENASFFVSGARPFALWVCVLVIAFAAILQPVTNWLLLIFGWLISDSSLPQMPDVPEIAWETIVWLIPLLYGARSIEGVFGVKRSSL